MASSISESLQSSWARRERILRLSALRGRESSSVTRERWAEEKKCQKHIISEANTDVHSVLFTVLTKLLLL